MSLTMLDDRDPSINYSGSWSQGGYDSNYQGTTTYPTEENGYFIVAFRGTQITVHGIEDATSGGVSAEYSIDGGPTTTVTALAKTESTPTAFWQSVTLQDSDHELKVRISTLNSRGSIYFDYFEIVNTPKQALGMKNVPTEGNTGITTPVRASTAGLAPIGGFDGRNKSSSQQPAAPTRGPHHGSTTPPAASSSTLITAGSSADTPTNSSDAGAAANVGSTKRPSSMGAIMGGVFGGLALLLILLLLWDLFQKRKAKKPIELEPMPDNVILGGLSAPSSSEGPPTLPAPVFTTWGNHLQQMRSSTLSRVNTTQVAIPMQTRVRYHHRSLPAIPSNSQRHFGVLPLRSQTNVTLVRDQDSGIRIPKGATLYLPELPPEYSRV